MTSLEVIEDFAMEQSCESNLYLDKIWFQCEDNHCLKWRLLSKEDAAHVDQCKPWYCYMNTDPLFNNCCIPEENHPGLCQLEKSGLKVIYSQLPAGSLVLVQICGWPRWPGILCPDPHTGQYILNDSDGDIGRYHVEFLGEPHTRYWALVRHVELYPTSFQPKEWIRKKEWYYTAFMEAKEIYPLTCEEKLSHCQLTGVLNKKSGLSNNKELSKNKKNGQKRTRVKKKKPDVGKSKNRRKLNWSVYDSEESYIVSKENMVVSETECILKDLEKVIKQPALLFVKATVEERLMEHKETETFDEISQIPKTIHMTSPQQETIGEISQIPETIPMMTSSQQFSQIAEGADEDSDENDCVVIDGTVIKTAEFLKSLTKEFQEIDEMIAEFNFSY